MASSTSLSGLLNLGSGALSAQQAGIAVTGKNSANVNTEGYSRQSVDLISQRLGVGGVITGATSRAVDDLLSNRERNAAGALGNAKAQAGALSGLERELTPNGNDVVQAIASLFGGFIDLASAPVDESVRASLVEKARAVSSAFQRASSAIESARVDSDQRLVSLADSANQLALKIAQANKALAMQKDPVLSDQRDLAARQLADLTGGKARVDSDGMMRVVLDGGQVLVDGERAARLTAEADPAYGGHMKISVASGASSVDVTKRLAGGQIAGEIAFRDGSAGKAQGDLDQLAFDLATRINAIHRGNAGLDGAAGRDFFGEPAQVAGAAAAFTVGAAVNADPRLIAAAQVGAPRGDNSGVNALVALRDQKLAGGGKRSFLDESIRAIGAVGSATAAANNDLSIQEARVAMLASTRTSVSGVSTQEEMSRLAAFQHAAEAAGHYISTVNDLMSYLMQQL